MLVAQMFPKPEFDPAASGREGRLAELKIQEHKYRVGLEDMKRKIRNFNSDPARNSVGQGARRRPGRNGRAALGQAQDGRRQPDRDDPGAVPPRARSRPGRARQAAGQDARATMPEHQRVLALLNDREEKAKQIARMEEQADGVRDREAALVNSDCVKIPAQRGRADRADQAEPAHADRARPGRELGLGIALVCLLEHVDHSVKVPEHVTHGLTLPLLGVVPRIRRTALDASGRASLDVGDARFDRGRRLSQRPGQPAGSRRQARADRDAVGDQRQGRRGKEHDGLEPGGHLRPGRASGPCCWMSTCGGPAWPMSSSRTDPTTRSTGWSTSCAASCPGSARSATPRSPTSTSSRPATPATIPIEILGTLELRQLLIALAHHYDRVILDGPAVLGLADCRVLGRIVDASLLVVRSGSHHLMTLHRAKAMLEQSHVVIAGVVFNGLTDDMNNWSSYGYEPLPLSGGRLEGRGPANRNRSRWRRAT